MTPAATEKPLVSVILATCNEAAFIENTVMSVLNHSADSFDLELLVIDNGSTDNTAAIVARLAAADSRTKLLRNSVKSTPAAFNLGLRAAQGEYVAILGAHASISASVHLNLPQRIRAQQCGRLQRKDSDCPRQPLSAGPGMRVGYGPSVLFFRKFCAHTARRLRGYDPFPRDVQEGPT